MPDTVCECVPGRDSTLLNEREAASVGCDMVREGELKGRLTKKRTVTLLFAVNASRKLKLNMNRNRANCDQNLLQGKIKQEWHVTGQQRNQL